MCQELLSMSHNAEKVLRFVIGKEVMAFEIFFDLAFRIKYVFQISTSEVKRRKIMSDGQFLTNNLTKASTSTKKLPSDLKIIKCS